jgi:hypothetical protein
MSFLLIGRVPGPSVCLEREWPDDWNNPALARLSDSPPTPLILIVHGVILPFQVEPRP